jgi:tetratricopeptide (TPR) repeat protein
MRATIAVFLVVFLAVSVLSCEDDKATGPKNAAPVAAFTISPSSGLELEVFTFDAAPTADDVDPIASLSFRWDWENDGVWDTSWSTAHSDTHSYQEANTYIVTLEAKDTMGLVGSASDTVVVNTPPMQLVAEGWSLFEAGNYSQAVAKFNEAVAIVNNIPEPYNGLGWCHAYMGELDTAVDIFLYVMEVLVLPRRDTYAGACLVYLAQKEYANARDMAGWAIELYGEPYAFQHDPDVTDETLRLARAISNYHLALYELAVIDVEALGGPSLDPFAPDIAERLDEAIQDLMVLYGEGLLPP